MNNDSVSTTVDRTCFICGGKNPHFISRDKDDNVTLECSNAIHVLHNKEASKIRQFLGGTETEQ